MHDVFYFKFCIIIISVLVSVSHCYMFFQQHNYHWFW
uniref:Uncharacterized protein n=1 Tax=Ciona intestinalis TaxID=7719 RepID=H2XPU2_CIOIN